MYVKCSNIKLDNLTAKVASFVSVNCEVFNIENDTTDNH